MFFFFKQKTAYEIPLRLVGSEMCIRDSLVDGVHANDIAALIDASGICIRSGHHCCQPLHRLYDVTASARASLSFTSTFEEIDRFSEELASTVAFLREHS